MCRVATMWRRRRGREGTPADVRGESLMMDRTRLDVPWAMHQMALDHGALFDPSTGGLYWPGTEVPAALSAFVTKQLRPRRHGPSPTCPICGCGMQRRHSRRSGDDFWSCSDFPKCKGTLEPDLEAVNPFDAVVSQVESRTDPVAQNTSTIPSAHLENMQAVIESALRVLGSESQAKRWLLLPKISLHGLTPLQWLREGRDSAEVLALLKEIDPGSVSKP